MSTPRNHIPLLSEALRDTPQDTQKKLISKIKDGVSKTDPPTKLYCITAILLSGSQNINLEITKQPQLSIPDTVNVTKDWDIRINIIAIKRDILLFELAPPPVRRPGTEVDELSPRIRDMVEDASKQGIKVAEDIRDSITITSETELSKSTTSGNTLVKIDSSDSSDEDEKKKGRITLRTDKIPDMTPRLITVTPRVTNSISPRVITANSYQITKEYIASFWIDEKSALYDRKVDFNSNEVKACLIEGLRTNYAISILDSIARVKTVLTCEDHSKFREYIGTLRLDSNVIRDLKPTRHMDVIRSRLLKERSVTILDMRELEVYEIKPIGLCSLIISNIQKPWCISCRVVKLETNSKGENILVSVGKNSLPAYYSVQYMDDILGFTDRYNGRDLLYVNFVTYETREILLSVIAELRLYIERHGLRRIKKEEILTNVSLD